MRLKEYEVLKKLGRGGMGVVYLVRHRLTKRIEVLKVLRPALASHPRLRERFLREVQAAARLDHPNIVKTFTAIQSGELLGLVMEYVDGHDLESMVQRSGPLTVASATTIVRQAALGLQHASDRSLIHRDIKPSNILVGRAEGQNVAKLSDFGLSKLHDEPTSDGLTVDGRFLGTPDYMAPEQGLDASSATVAADIYGLGCSLYYTLVGRPPYAGGNALAILNAHINAAVPDARLSRHDVPPELSTIMRRMMQKDPRDRYATPSDVAAALEPFTMPSGHSASEAPLPATSHPSSEPSSTQTLSPDQLTLTGSHHTDTAVRPPIRKRVAARRGRNGPSVVNTLLQLGMPIAVLVGLIYLQPWAHLKWATDGTLRLKELTPGIVIEIDNSIRVVPDEGKSIREISLSPGAHRLRFLHGAQTIAQRSIEIKPNGTVELSASLTGLGNKDRGSRTEFPNVPQRNGRRVERSAQQLSTDSESSEPHPNSFAEVPLASPPTSAEKEEANEPTEVPSKPLQPTIHLANSAWTLELQRQLSGLESSPDGLLILPPDITDLRAELIIATGSQLRAWDAKTGFPQNIFTPFNVTGISVANNQKSVLYFDETKCEVWVVQKPKPKRWFWTNSNPSVDRVFAMSSDSRFLGCCDFNESFIRWDLSDKEVVGTMTARQPQTAARLESIHLTARLDNVLALGKDGSISCWATSDGEQLGFVQAEQDASKFDTLPIGLHVNNIARQAIVVSRGGYVDTRKLPTLELIERQKVVEAPVLTSSYSTRILALATEAGEVSLLDGTDLTSVGTIDCPASAAVTTVTVSVDGRCVAVAFADGSIYVARIRRTLAAGNTANEQNRDSERE